MECSTRGFQMAPLPNGLGGRAYSHRILLARLKCLSEKQWLEITGQLGREPDLPPVRGPIIMQHSGLSVSSIPAGPRL
jgi:hypothetical protein